MAGIYIHIPYCKKRCNYCDFYKTTNINSKSGFLVALLHEIDQRSDFFVDNHVDTIYFGGGTPSVLNADELNVVFDALNKYFRVADVPEITLEANPDDFTQEWGGRLRLNTPVNRLSFGLQSIYDSQLRVMGRRHNSVVGLDAVSRAFDLGFDNVTADLIYGLPGLTLEMWEQTLGKTLSLPIKHLSSYHLTYEAGTPFYTDLKKGYLTEIDEDLSLQQFNLLVARTKERGMVHYETSNFALPGFESKHNSNYWTGAPYIGFGPSAHSFWKNERRWNESNLSSYIKMAATNQGYFDSEILTDVDRYNEILMLGLRTRNGVSIERVRQLGSDFHEQLLKSASDLVERNELIIEGEYLRIPESLKFVADGIIQKLFLV